MGMLSLGKQIRIRMHWWARLIPICLLILRFGQDQIYTVLVMPKKSPNIRSISVKNWHVKWPLVPWHFLPRSGHIMVSISVR